MLTTYDLNKISSKTFAARITFTHIKRKIGGFKLNPQGNKSAPIPHILNEHPRIVVKCSEFLLGLKRKNSPQELAKQVQGGPMILGDVLIHPTASIHPTAKVYFILPLHLFSSIPIQTPPSILFPVSFLFPIPIPYSPFYSQFLFPIPSSHFTS
jgi:hypothetical protein